MSIGIVTYPDDGADAGTLMKNADFAMYHAKDSGRNNHQFFKSSMNVRAAEQQALENDLRYAIELELTETFLMQDSMSTSVVLQALKEMGVQLALDDFGTGYSSLSYLKRFPINTVKIDRSFVRDLTTDADDASIVSAVIGMGKRLHMQVVAEGVETSEQRAFLQEQCCSEGQGYYFGRPVVAEDFAILLGRGHPARTRIFQPQT